MLNVHTVVLTHAFCSDPKATRVVGTLVWGMYYTLRRKTPSLSLGEICGAVSPKMLASHHNKPFLSPKTMQNTAIPKISCVSSKYVTLKIYVIIWGRNDHVKKSYVKVRWREYPQIILCLAVLNILGSHEVTAFIFQMVATKALFSSLSLPAPTSGGHTLVGKISGEMALVKTLIYLLLFSKATNKEMQQQQWGRGWHLGASVPALMSICCIHLLFTCLTLEAA
nr:uncharacterized protein LOC129471143 [Symphalangus syndactylus]